MRNSIGIALIAIIGLAMTACDDGIKGPIDPIDGGIDLSISPIDVIGGDAIDESALSSYQFTYSAQPGLSRIMGWQWKIPYEGYDFKWFFNSDGIIPVIHCCGWVELDEKYRYLLCGNILATSYSGRDIKIDYITMAANDASFTWNGTTYPRGDPQIGPLTAPPMHITNDLIGTWQGDDAEFIFGSDSRVLINSEEYGYLVFQSEMLTIGPLVEGEPAGLYKYTLKRTGNKLNLKRSDGEKYTLELAVIPLAE